MSKKLATTHSRHLFDFIEVLHREQERFLSPENQQKSKFNDLIDALAINNWLRVDEKDIKSLQDYWEKNNVIDLEKIATYGNKVFYLPPIEKGGNYFVVMSIKINCNDADYEAMIRVMLLQQDDVRDSNKRTPQKFRGIGFRLEQGAGRHDYHHAQLINDFKGSNSANIFFESVPWLPIEHPAFPLKAHEPLTLMTSFYITLYGLDGLRLFTTYEKKLQHIWMSPEVKEFTSFLSTQKKSKKK